MRPNEIKPPTEKYSENINQSDIILRCPESNCRAHLVYDNLPKFSFRAERKNVCIRFSAVG